MCSDGSNGHVGWAPGPTRCTTCKLARETKAATILQLSLYSELLGELQRLAAGMDVRSSSGHGFPAGAASRPGLRGLLSLRQTRLERAVEPRPVDPAMYPEPNPHCDVCRWWSECDTRWRRDDHLSLVAGISQLQRKQLQTWQVGTVAQLAALPLPLAHRPDHGSQDSYVRGREQARVQVEGRRQARPVHELLEIAADRGFAAFRSRLPATFFFDLEGDPFVAPAGREYLFGFVAEGYECRWALTPEDEKAAFQWFIDLVMARWREHPGMHIYHYADYEPSALKRLMGRYATREDEVDRMLRAKLLVDLRTVTKQALRASVEEYSLKALEVFHRIRTHRCRSSRRALPCVRSSTPSNSANVPTSTSQCETRSPVTQRRRLRYPRARCATGSNASEHRSSNPVNRYRVLKLRMARRRNPSTNASSV